MSNNRQAINHIKQSKFIKKYLIFYIRKYNSIYFLAHFKIFAKSRKDKYFYSIKL